MTGSIHFERGGFRGPFTSLTDTPPDYIGQARKALAVKPTEDGIEFPGLAYLRNTTTQQIFVEADFPAPVDGVITLVSGVTYEINANISMANRFELPDFSVILMRMKRSNTLSLTYTGTGNFFSNAPGGFGIADFELQDIRINTTDTVSARLFNLKGNKAFSTTFVTENFFFAGKRAGLIENFGLIALNFCDYSGMDEEGIDFFNCQFHTVF